jgi:hypothetical protein
MRTLRYSKGGDTQSKINTLQKLVDDKNTPETDRKNFQEAIKKFQEKLASETKAAEAEKPKRTSTAKTVAKKPISTAKPVSKPVSKPVAKSVVKKATVVAKPKKTAKPVAKKIPKGVQMLSKKRVVVNGKEMNTDSKEFCDYLTDEFIKRKEQAKSKKGTRKKTKSVMEQVATKIEQGVEKAIKTGITKQKPTLKKNPKVFIGKVQKLETATKNFLTQLKEVLGTDYDAKEVSDSVNAIHKLIEDLKKKYEKK